MQTGRLRGAKLQRYVAADIWRAVHVPERSYPPARRKKCSSQSISVRGMKIVRAMYSSFGTYPPSRHVWLSCEGQAPSAV